MKMSQLKRLPIRASVFVLAIAVVLFFSIFWSRLFPIFHVVEIKPVPVVETKLSGERTVYQTLHVSVAGYPRATEADMYAYAELIFSNQLRDMADRQGKSQIWITFLLEKVVINGQEKIRTFRTIFANEGRGWHRLEPNAAKKDTV
jgi:hypothetical protein